MPTTPGSPHRGKSCHGVCVSSLDRERFDPVLAGLHLAQAFYEIHPQRFKVYEGFATETGDREAWGLLTRQGKTPEEVAVRWDDALKNFRKVREGYLLY